MNAKKHHNEFVDHRRELLEQFGIITARRMFGGFGIYKDGVIFALIIDQELYFKADVEAANFFATYGSEPFTYQRHNKLIKMSYWKVIPEVLEDQELLRKWFDLAHSAS